MIGSVGVLGGGAWGTALALTAARAGRRTTLWARNIATVNSIRQREAHVQRWLSACQPDVLFLQEIKCESHVFPAEALANIGYVHQAVSGQKAPGIISPMLQRV